MARSSEARVLAAEEVLEFTRIFDAPRELVWRLWRDPEHMVRWHGPETLWLTTCELDFRVGGKWRRCMTKGPEYEHWIHGEYLDIREPERLQFTYINDADGHEMVVTMDFLARGDRTEMHFHQAPFMNVAERDGHGWGWHSSFELFGSYLALVKEEGGKPVGPPRRDGVAEDLIAARKRLEEKQNADAAKDR